MNPTSVLGIGTLLAALLPAASCRSQAETETTAVPEAVAPERRTHIDVWSCETHPFVRLEMEAKCPICSAPTAKTRFHLTYRQYVTYFCPEHAGNFESPGTCPECGRQTEPFHGEKLVEETRELLGK